MYKDQNHQDFPIYNRHQNDYGTYGMWGSILSGGEVVTSKLTFRDNRWAAEFFGWTMV